MSVFQFKEFSIEQSNVSMKVGTDAMLLGSFIEVENSLRALDIGTGSGVLALMLAQKSPSLYIDAIDIDSDNILTSKFNFENSRFSKQLNAIKINFLEYKPLNQYDLIFSNPPYFENGLLNLNKRKSVARHEYSLPLKDLFDYTFPILSDEGNFWIILPYENFQKWIRYAESIKLYCINEIIINGKSDYPKRVVLSFSKVNKTKSIKVFTIRDNQNSYTDEYINLTIGYHNISLKKS